MREPPVGLERGGYWELDIPREMMLARGGRQQERRGFPGVGMREAIGYGNGDGNGDKDKGEDGDVVFWWRPRCGENWEL